MSGSGGNEGSGGQKVTSDASPSLVGDYGCSDSDSADEARGAIAAGGAELSDMVLKNNIINACAHGPLLPAASGGTEPEAEARHIMIDSSGGGVIEYTVEEYREGAYSDDSVSSDSFTDVDSVKDAEEHSSSGEEEDEGGERGAAGEGGREAPPRVRGELGLEDLPPIEELTITVPEHLTSPIGKVFNIVEKLVIVRALPGSPAVDLDSILFLDKGQRVLGKVFDVFGPVSEPYYCVRFNSEEHIQKHGVESGMEVFIAPQTDHTNFLFVSDLMKMKGSDASWLHDVEPPPGQVEYSDDEEERRATRARREQRRAAAPPTAAGAATAATATAARRPRLTRFEEQMNRRNLQRTAEANSRFGSGPNANNRFRNPFGATRRNPPPMPQPPPWGGSWPREEAAAPVPFALTRPMFNPYGPPGFNPQTPPPFAPSAPFQPNGPFASNGMFSSRGPFMSNGQFAPNNPFPPSGPFVSTGPFVSGGPYPPNGPFTRPPFYGQSPRMPLGFGRGVSRNQLWVTDAPPPPPPNT